MKNEKEILSSCTAAERYHRGNLSRPFIQNGMVVATDAHNLVRFSVSLIDDRDFSATLRELGSPNVSSVIPEPTESITLTAGALRQALSEAPMVEEPKTCPECDGTGTVCWTYEGKSEYYHRDDTCPRCSGKGNIGSTGRQIRDPQHVFDIGGIPFSTKTTEWLLRLTELLETDHLIIRHHDPGGLIFLTSPNVEIIATGVIPDLLSEEEKAAMTTVAIQTGECQQNRKTTKP